MAEIPPPLLPLALQHQLLENPETLNPFVRDLHPREAAARLPWYAARHTRGFIDEAETANMECAVRTNASILPAVFPVCDPLGCPIDDASLSGFTASYMPFPLANAAQTFSGGKTALFMHESHTAMGFASMRQALLAFKWQKARLHARGIPVHPIERVKVSNTVHAAHCTFLVDTERGKHTAFVYEARGGLLSEAPRRTTGYNIQQEVITQARLKCYFDPRFCVFSTAPLADADARAFPAVGQDALHVNIYWNGSLSIPGTARFTYNQVMLIIQELYTSLLTRVVNTSTTDRSAYDFKQRKRREDADIVAAYAAAEARLSEAATAGLLLEGGAEFMEQ